jgi:hypothetical protein
MRRSHVPFLSQCFYFIFLLCIIINLIILAYPGCRSHDRMVQGIKLSYISIFFLFFQDFAIFPIFV